MATINGVTFNLTGLIFDTDNRNVLGRSPGRKTNPINNYGMDGLSISLTGFEVTQAAYDSVMTAFMANGSELVVRTGWMFEVYARLGNLAEVSGFADNYFPYRFDLVCSDAYTHSTSETTRLKTITTNNQEWSADDSANDITTSGTIEAVPDIRLVAGEGSGYGGTGADSVQTDATQYSTASDTYVLKKTFTFTGRSGKAWLATNLQLDAKMFINTEGKWKYTAQATSLNAGVETEMWEGDHATTVWTEYSSDVSGDAHQAGHNEDLVIRLYIKDNTGAANTIYVNDEIITCQEQLLQIVDDVQIYNTADTTIKCDICNLIHPETTVNIRSDGTGDYSYEDDFSDNKFYYDTYYYINAVFNTDQADISNSGYIEYVFDLKYSIVGIPVLTALIDVTAGTPTIKIAEDNAGAAGTYYDIDTAIVDNVSTEYELDNDANLHIKGKTKIWIKIDCDASATCSVEALQLDCDLVTMDAEHPVINTGAANTFRCDQSSDSSVDCEVSLIYRDRKWAA